MKHLKTAFKKPSFLSSVLLSFIAIIIVCTVIMGTFFFHILNKLTIDRTTAANHKLLNQYKNSVESLLLGSLNDVSVKIINDIHNNSYLYRYFSLPLENNTTDIYDVSQYLVDMKLVNPLINSLSIYYMDNELLVSTDYIRHNLYADAEKQKDLEHYRKIVMSAAAAAQSGDTGSLNAENLGLVFDYVKNLNYKLPGYLGRKLPETVIHAVRPIYGGSGTIRGAVILTVSSEIFSAILNEVAPTDLGSVFIIDRTGLIVCHTESKFVGKNIYELGQLSAGMLNGNSDNFTEKVNGAPAVVSYQRSEHSDWTYISIAPVGELFSAIKLIYRPVFLVSFSSILIGFMISFIAATRLAKPLRQIADTCLAIPQVMESKNEYTLIKSTLNEFMNVIRKKDIEALLSPDILKRDDIVQKLKAPGIRPPYRHFCPLAVKIIEHSNATNNVKATLASKLEEVFTTNHSTCVQFVKDDTVTVLVNYDFDESELIGLANRAVATIIGFTAAMCPCVAASPATAAGPSVAATGSAQDSSELSVYITMGAPVTDIINIPSSYRLALNGLSYSFLFPEKHLYTYSEIKAWEESITAHNQRNLNNLANSLKSLNRANAISDLKEALASIREANLSYQQALAGISLCISLVLEFLHTHGDEQESSLKEALEKVTDIRELENRLCNIIDQVFDKRESTCAENTDTQNCHTLVQKAKKLADTAIRSSQISVKYIAMELGVNEKYLSRIFKNETNIKLVDYLTNLKLNYSRSLLADSNLKIEEIASIMGYSTSQYFISRFKLMFGCTPGEYREGLKYDFVNGKSQNCKYPPSEIKSK